MGNSPVREPHDREFVVKNASPLGVGVMKHSQQTCFYSGESTEQDIIMTDEQ